MVGAYSGDSFDPGPQKAAVDQGKDNLHNKIKAWAKVLCVELAYESIIMNPEKYFLVEEVREDLKLKGFFPPQGGLYAGQDKAESDYVKERIGKTLFHFDKVGERAKKLESIFLGMDWAVVGKRTASSPGQLHQPAFAGGTSGLLHGRYIGTHVWEFKQWQAFTAGSRPYGTGIFEENWNDWIKGDILKYFKAVLDEGKDADTPGAALLIQLALHYQALWSEDYIALTKKMKAGGSGAQDWIALIGQHFVAGGTSHPAMDPANSHGNFFELYGSAFQILKDYAEAMGWFSEECVLEEEKILAKQLVPILGTEIIQLDERLQHDPVLGAITGMKPLPPPDPIHNLRPFDFQCFLIENIVYLSDLRQNTKYTNIIKLSTNNNPGTVLSRINHGGQTEQVRQLMSLCPEAYALLEPSIKIYRVDYDKNNPTQPIGEQELHIPNFIDPSDIQTMLSAGGGRSKGYGLKSFNWSLAGVQPAEVDNNITAKMTFYFQSIRDLFQGQLAAGQPEPSPLDLIISARASDQVRNNQTNTSISLKPADTSMLNDTINQEYEGASFRIKASIGWNIPPNFATAFPSFNEIVPGTNKSKGTLITEAIRHTQMHLFLQQTVHQINFKEDGTIELDIEYKAALAGILTAEKSNILATDQTFFEDEIEGYRAEIAAEGKGINTAFRGQAASPDATGHYSTSKERVDEMLEEIENLETQNRMYQYKKFLQKLYTKDKIYNLAVQPAELLIPPWKDLTAGQRAARAKRRLSPNEFERGFKTSANNSFDTSLLKAVETASREPGKAETELDQQGVNNAARFKSFSLTGETIMIPYFYLGDLLDLILETLPGYDDGEKFLFFLSEIELLNPLLAFQVKNLNQVLSTDNFNDAKFLAALRNSDPTRFSNITQLQNIINIGDVPISLDAFTVWFKDNVIKQDREHYYFLYFIKDVCSQLITNALRGDCFGDSVKFDIRFDTANITISKGLKPGSRTTVNTLAHRKAAVSTKAHPKSIIPGMVLYSTDSKPKSRRGKFEEDLKVGIYHHYVGSACSIVKSINFHRQDQPFYREAKIQKVGALGATQLRELYTVSLDLIGNTLHKNGQYIYVDPTFVAGDPTLARIMGINGYYLVSSVDHSISEAGYDVKIVAYQEGINFDENSKAVSVQFLDSEMEGTPTWTAPELTADELDMLSKTANAAAVAALGVGAEAYAAALVEDYSEIFDTLTDDQLNWDDAWALLQGTKGLPSNVAGAGMQGAQAAWNSWNESRELQGRTAKKEFGATD